MCCGQFEIQFRYERSIGNRVGWEHAASVPEGASRRPETDGENTFLNGLLDNALWHAREFSDFPGGQRCNGCHKSSLQGDYLNRSGSACKTYGVWPKN